jgi:hypothetical protein
MPTIMMRGGDAHCQRRGPFAYLADLAIDHVRRLFAGALLGDSPTQVSGCLPRESASFQEI